MENIITRVSLKGWIAIFIIFIVGTVLPGCIGQIIDAPPPQGAEARNLDTDMKLDESIRAYNAYVRQENAFMESWAANIQEAEDKAAQWAGVFSQLTSPEALTAYGLNPASGAITAALFGAGLFFRRPGDVSQQTLAKEKEDSFNYGQERAKEIKNG